LIYKGNRNFAGIILFPCKCNWKVKSRDKAVAYLKSKGLKLIEGPERTTLEPSAIFGARYTFSDSAPG
jgi:hypothetical protein